MRVTPGRAAEPDSDLIRNKSNSQIKLIMLDVGGVILNYSQTAHLTLMATELGIKPEIFIPFTDKLTEEMEIGSITLQDAENKVSKKFNVPASKVMWMESFMKSSEPNFEMINLANKLHKKFKIAITTNIETFIYKAVFGKNGMLEKNLAFDKIFASCYMKVRKPSLEYFEHVLNDMKVNPQNSILVDDNPFNVTAASSLGIKSILFSDFKTLKYELERFGIRES